MLASPKGRPIAGYALEFVAPVIFGGPPRPGAPLGAGPGSHPSHGCPSARTA